MATYEAGGSSIEDFLKVWEQTRQHVAGHRSLKSHVDTFGVFLRERLVEMLHEQFANAKAEWQGMEEAGLLVKAIRSINEACRVS